METTDPRQRRFDRFKELLELPMLALAVLLIPVIVMPAVEELSPWSEAALFWIGVAIWLAFVVEYLALLLLAPDRRRMIRTHKLELALVVLPVLRPARLFRLGSAGVALARIGLAVRRLLGRPGFSPIVGAVAGFMLAGGVLVSIAEHEQEGATIDGLADGIWWAFVTCTTVGYGDSFPVTASGRVIAVALMLLGISGLSAITANVAAYFVAADVEEETDELDVRLDAIEAQLQRLTDGLLGPDGR
ncbi:MAG: ion channel [Actinomycetota bacterium]